MLFFTGRCAWHNKPLKKAGHTEVFLSEAGNGFELHWAAFRCPTGEKACYDDWAFAQVEKLGAKPHEPLERTDPTAFSYKGLGKKEI